MKTILFALFLSIISTVAAAFTTTGFQGPYGVAIDPKTNNVYVSNVNGDPANKDNNGFISRLKPDGSVDQIKFIDGAATKDLNLHAPKGMVVLGSTLYVADIDKLHAFDITTGKKLFDVNFGDLTVKHFYDIAVGPDNILYLTDGGANIIYRIDVARLHEVTTLAGGDFLGGPRGIKWYPTRQIFLVALADSGEVIALDRAGKRQAVAQMFVKPACSIALDDLSRLYLTSNKLNSVYLIQPNMLISAFRLGVIGATGIAYASEGKQLIVSLYDSNEVQSFPLDQ